MASDTQIKHLLNRSNQDEFNAVMEFLESLTEEERERFFGFIQGAIFVKRLNTQQPA